MKGANVMCAAWPGPRHAARQGRQGRPTLALPRAALRRKGIEPAGNPGAARATSGNPWPRSGVSQSDMGVRLGVRLGGRLVGKAQLAKALLVVLVVLVLGARAPAVAAAFDDMLGTWRWQDFTIEVRACGEVAFACAKVVAGPKNVGMD